VFVKSGIALFGDHFLESFVRVERASDGKNCTYLGEFKIQHPDQVMDLVEVTSPFKAIITACLDGNMRAYSQNRLIWTFKGS
jgi:hypothetical protein